jgi:hypothetical protein
VDLIVRRYLVVHAFSSFLVGPGVPNRRVPCPNDEDLLAYASKTLLAVAVLLLWWLPLLFI